MKAICLSEPYHIGTVDLQDPVPAPGEALLRIRYCGICGADVASYTGNQPFTTYPRIPGHEFSAEVVKIGENSKQIKPGDLVTANPYFNCGHCYACRRGFVNCCTDNRTMGVQRDGSFCEYVSMPVERLIPGSGLDAKQLALIEPFCISYHALSHADIRPGDRVLITGAGPIGLFALIAARQKGARVCVSDMLAARLELAKKLGALRVVNIREEELKGAAFDFTDGNGFDLCVEACGQPATFLDCIEQACFAGQIVLIGNGKRETTFNHSILLKKELRVFGSRNALTSDFEQVIGMVSAGQIDVMQIVSSVYPMSRAAEAFEALAHNDGTLAKVLIDMTDCT